MSFILSQMPPHFLLGYCRLPPFYGKGHTAESAQHVARLNCLSELRYADQGIASSWTVVSRLQPCGWECSYFVVTNAARKRMAPLEQKLVDQRKVRVVLVDQNHLNPSSVIKDISGLLEQLGGFSVLRRRQSDIPSVVYQNPDIVVVPHKLGDSQGHDFVSAYHAKKGSGKVIVVGQGLRNYIKEYHDLGCSWLVSLASPEWKDYFSEALRCVCASLIAQYPSKIIISKKFKPLSARDIYRIS